jgi:hypothetical protein
LRGRSMNDSLLPAFVGAGTTLGFWPERQTCVP